METHDVTDLLAEAGSLAEQIEYARLLHEQKARDLDRVVLAAIKAGAPAADVAQASRLAVAGLEILEARYCAEDDFAIA